MTESFDSAAFTRNLTSRPGVYRMYGADGKLLYVGKAKNLKKRVSSYFRKNLDAIKTRALVEKIARMEVTVTASETEALLLEQTLIKENRPPYNIVLRDDKSYPYIFLSDEKFPRLSYHRGAKKKKGQYFGPYPSAGAVRETMNLLEKIFKVRQCEDSFFRNRSRPCLQYQIERCTAPCVDYISAEDYAEDVRHTAMFLKGKTTTISEELAQKMETASANLQFEVAAQYRDQITAIRRVQEQQLMEADGGDVDVFGIALQAGTACIQLVFVRGGRVIGFQRYFQQCKLEDDPGRILDAFLPQYYLGNRARDLPKEVILPVAIDSQDALVSAIEESQGKKLGFSVNVRGHRAGWVNMANSNAEQNLGGHLAAKENIYQRFESLQQLLNLDDMPQRMECFDISHTQGEGTVASCVVFDQNGPVKSDYRRFNIEGITPGDDYAAMKQALQRRYTRLKKGEGKIPDILLIDGGKGQLTQAREVLADLQVAGVYLVGVAKGVTRKAGLETLIVDGVGEEIQPRPDTPGLHLIQHIRDEAHRFAITAHRQRRSKARNTSPLEGIPGVGPKRRRQLLNHFGGWQEVARASVADLAKVKGISQKVAEDIYTTLHND